MGSRGTNLASRNEVTIQTEVEIKWAEDGLKKQTVETQGKVSSREIQVQES